MIRYDASGNPTTYRGYTMTWQGRRLVSAINGTNTISYSYDENGLRTQKTVNGTATQYRYHGSVLISQVTGNNKLLFSYDASGNVAAVNYNGTYYYYVRNGQGDIVKLIDGNNNTVVEYTYDSWGKQLSCTGSLASTLGTQNPFRYRGYIYDAETGLYYLQSRYYDPAVGRFINADIYMSTGQGVLGHNMYLYCGNNPVNRIDNGGELWIEILILIGLGGAALMSSGCNYTGNCYQYATGATFNIITKGCYMPGFSKGVAEGTYIYSADDLQLYIQADLDACYGTGKYTVEKTDSKSEPGSNSWKIAYCYSKQKKDFHFYRYDTDSGWTHKQGFIKSPTSLDKSGKQIGNLDAADRGTYDSPLVYLLITKN